LFTLATAYAQTTVIAPPPPSDYQQAMQLYRGAQYDKAMARVEAWLRERPKDARGRFLRGMILSRQQKVDEAIRVYTDLTQDFPELPEPYNNLAVIYADRGELDRALGLLDTAIRANPSFAAAQENLGDIHIRLAAAAYDKALKLDTKSSALAAKLKAANELVPSRPANPAGSAAAKPR
jgi:Flp pilus assembly protein TadD